MPKPLTTTADYRKLLADIRKEMEHGLKRVAELLERQKVLSYWAIGRKINVYLNTHEMPPGAVGAFYDGLSRDLEMHGRTLQQCEQFFRYFPKFKPDKGLKWSHYRFLLSVPEAARRRAWIARIKKEDINTDQLRLMLMPAGATDDLPEFNLKSPTRGKLYTYRLLRADDIENFEVPWFVDLGFAGCAEAPAFSEARRRRPPSKAALDNKYLYTSEKVDGTYRLKVTNAKVSDLFTFRGKLRRLPDADSPVLLIDQGFGKWILQRLRLNGIDAPEIDTLAGQRARKWVENELKGAENLVIKTYKTDKWDRYLVDIFYLPKEKDLHRIAAEGLWLNGRMVEAGIAKVWKR